MKIFGVTPAAGDGWGALAAMLVALPSSIAFGVAVYSPLGPAYIGQGALAGIIGATVIGFVAPLFGGTQRLISGPCAPAAAVMSALAIGLVKAVPLGSGGAQPERVLVLMTLVALLAGALQLLFGRIGGGRLIKYIPYPVVSGYLSGVGLLILLSQLPKLLGLPKETSLWLGILSPSLWRWESLVVGAATVVVMSAAPRMTRAVPAAILGLLGGVAAYFALGLMDPELLKLAGNPLVIGPLKGTEGSLFGAWLERWKALGQLKPADLRPVLAAALTLSVLLSIDTLKTCVVLDSLTRSRHDSNRELVGQGLGNLASAFSGGIPGAGTMGATLVNITSGGQSRASSVLEGVLVLAAFLMMSRAIAWVPIAVLAGILIVVAYRMFDKDSLHLLRSRSTRLDFLVVAAVVGAAVSVSLIAAAGAGLALAMLLFIREQIGGSVIRRKVYGNQIFSKQRRLPYEMEFLERRGESTVVCELQGSLFFGTTDQLYTELEADIKTRRYVILDMRRVQSVDFTAAHMLQQIEARLADRQGQLLFSDLPQALPTGQELGRYFDEVGLVKPSSNIRIFPELDEALEWAEDRLLEEIERLPTGQEAPLELREIDFLKGRKEDTIAALGSCVVPKSFRAGENIFRRGEPGDELYFIRRGSVRISLPLKGGKGHHLATFTRGDFFGDIAFLDRGARSADAVAFTDADLFVLSFQRFEAMMDAHPRLGQQFFASLARALALRMRYADAELRALQEA